MTYDVEAAGRPRVSPDGYDKVDRILFGVCAAIWLIALGATVAAIVALVDLGQGDQTASGDSDTPWLLYTVIAVSALVIAGAIPLLIRARRTALDAGQRPVGEGRPAAQSHDVFGPPLGTEARGRTVAGPAIRRQPAPPATSRVGFPTAAVEQLLLRSTLVIAATIGAATAAVGIGTYLMASDYDGAAWAAFIVAGLITVAMPAVPWFYLKQLHQLLA